MRETTERGFAIYAQFTDRYGAKVRVQESSLATDSCVWVFAQEPNGHLASPHLTVDMARQLRDALSEFIADQEKAAALEQSRHQKRSQAR